MSALNGTGVARVNSVSCASPGNCSAGGYYNASIKGTTYGQPFVVNEVNGSWHKAIPVPGVHALNTGKNGFISSVSCTRPGDCSAGGRYVGPDGAVPFVVNEVNGTWHNAITLPVSGVGDVEVSSLACASPGNCSAGGTTSTGGTANGLDGTFVVNEVNGSWRKPIVIPGKLTFIYGARVDYMACPTAGNCTAAGWYLDGSDRDQAFAASEVNGTWHGYITVPGTSAAPGTAGAQVASLSCPQAGDCALAGRYLSGSDFVGFLASEVNGTWHNAKLVPGLASLTGTGSGQVAALSCTKPGDCSGGGWYDDSQNQSHPFVISEANGAWRNAIRVPGMGGLDTPGRGFITALSCATPGNCSAGGSYPGARFAQGFVVNEVNGTWRNAIEVPGMSALNPSGSSQVTALSCAGPGVCGAGGYYAATSYGLFAGQVFVVNER